MLSPPNPKYGGDLKLISAGDVILKDGKPAYAYVQSGQWQGLENCTGKTLLVMAGGTKGFMVIGYTTSDLYPKQESLINEILYSFHVE